MEDKRETAFRRMYIAHYQQIAAYARRRAAREDADDAVAETFLVAWRRLEDIPSGVLSLPWLYGVARRVLSEGRRSSSRRDRLVIKLTKLRGRDDPGTTAYDRFDEKEVVHQALARLRPDDQELLLLAEWEELTHAQLAVAFSCSVNAVTIRLHRAHRKFGAELRALEADSAGLKGGLEEGLG